MKSDIILLHGALGSNRQFAPLVPLLTSNFTVHRFDFKGHGTAPSDLPLSIDLFKDQLDAFIRTNHLLSADIFGYSMGGYVALDWASDHTDYQGHIVTLGTKFDWNEATAAQEVKMLNPDKIEEKVPAFANRLKELHGEMTWREVVLKTGAMMLNMGANPPLTIDKIRSIKCRVTIGLGDNDKMVTQTESETTAKALENASFNILANFPHPIEQVAPEPLAKWISNTLKSSNDKTSQPNQG